ncbi:hypothetical protein COOONC_06631 [Cooperia oncophora]
MNLVLQRIPPSCTVINPMPELRPYMSCLRSDEDKRKAMMMTKKRKTTRKKTVTVQLLEGLEAEVVEAMKVKTRDR